MKQTTLALLISFFAINVSAATQTSVASPAPSPVAPLALATPAPTPKPVEDFPRVYIGLSSADFQFTFGGDQNPNIQIGAMLGYLLTAHQQINVGYSHDYSAISSSAGIGTNHYWLGYRFYLLGAPQNALYIQGAAGWYSLDSAIQGINTTSFAYSFDIGKNFRIFGDDSNFVFAPTFGLEKISGQNARYRFVPISFGLYL